MSIKSLSQATTYCSEAAFNAAQLCSSIRRSQRLLDKSLRSDSKKKETSMNFQFNDNDQSQQSIGATSQGTYQISVSKRKYYVGKSRSPQLFDKFDDNINFLTLNKDLSGSLPFSQTSKKVITKRRTSTTSRVHMLPTKCVRKLESTTRNGRPRQVRKPRRRPPGHKNEMNVTSKSKTLNNSILRGFKNILEQDQGNVPFSFASTEQDAVNWQMDSGTTTRDSAAVYSRSKSAKKSTSRGLKNIIGEDQGSVPFSFTSAEKDAVHWKMDSGTTTRDSVVYSKPKNVNKPKLRGLINSLEHGQNNVPFPFTSVEQAAVNWKMDSATTSRNSTNLNMTATCSSSNQSMHTNSFDLLPMDGNYYNPPIGDKPILATGVNNIATSKQNTEYRQQTNITGTAAGHSLKSILKKSSKVPLSSCVLPPIERYYNPPIEEKPVSSVGVNSHPSSIDPTVYPTFYYDGRPITTRKSTKSNMRDSFKTYDNYHDLQFGEKPTLAAGIINSPSMLPAEYPPHFVHQLSPTTAASNQHFAAQNQQSAQVNGAYYESQAPFIDDFDMDLSPSPPLSDSWNEVFGGKNLREVLNIEPIRYRLTEEQLAAVALIMNVELARLRGVMNLVQKLPQSDVTKMAAEINGNSAESAYQLSNDMNSLLQRYETNRSPSMFSSQYKNYIPTE